MITMLKNWKGAVEVNGSTYNTVNELYQANLDFDGQISIKLLPPVKKAVNGAGNAKKYRIQRVSRNTELQLRSI